MKVIKTIVGILLIIGSLASLMSFFNEVSSYEAPEFIGHLLAIVLISWFAYLLLKPSKKA